MNTAQKQHEWNDRLRSFNDEKFGRATRLGVFEPSETGVNDYWLESGLPFRGIAFEERGGRLSAEILLEGYTHHVENAGRVELIYGTNQTDDGLNVVDRDGRTSALRFE